MSYLTAILLYFYAFVSLSAHQINFVAIEVIWSDLCFVRHFYGHKYFSLQNSLELWVVSYSNRHKTWELGYTLRSIFQFISNNFLY